MEALAEALKKIPDMVGNQLLNLKAMDKESKDLINLLNEQETKFLEELKVKCVAKEIEGTPYIESHQQLVAKRHEALAKLDLQMKNVQYAYDQIDKKIAYIDNCTKHLSHLLPAGLDENGSEYRKKKKKRLNTDIAEVLQPDPNEPLYCTCRQVSHGSMVGCENPDCQTEWFHFACVGLVEEPVDPWYCSDCKESPVVPTEGEVSSAGIIPFE